MTRLATIRAASFAALLLGATPALAHAQSLRPPPTAAECSGWASDLSAGGAPALSAVTTGWPASCAGAAQMLAPALQSARLSGDDEYLFALAAQAADVRDASVFAAALALAEDPGATTPARAAGLLVTVAELGGSWVFPGVSGPALLTTALPSSGLCGPGAFGQGSGAAGTPLPSNAARLAAGVFDRTADAAGNPALLRNLARCSRAALGASIPPQVDVSQAQLTYVCGTTFRVQNPASRRLVFSYTVDGAAEAGDIPVEANGQADFRAEATGTVRLLYDGQLLKTQVNGGQACP